MPGAGQRKSRKSRKRQKVKQQRNGVTWCFGPPAVMDDEPVKTLEHTFLTTPRTRKMNQVEPRRPGSLFKSCSQQRSQGTLVRYCHTLCTNLGHFTVTRLLHQHFYALLSFHMYTYYPGQKNQEVCLHVSG